MKIQVCGRSVYGAIKLYPVNDAAKVLAELCGQKTLRAIDLARAEMLGHQIEYVADPQVNAAIQEAAL